MAVLRQHQNWLDRRHLKTLAWRMVGLIQAAKISLTAWAPEVHRRAVSAQSRVRRFACWLENSRIDAQALYGPLVPDALAEWEHHGLQLALDTSMLWNTYGLVRLARVSRGRAVPLGGTVLAHPSSSVAQEVYHGLLDQGAQVLPEPCSVVFTADRGFAATHLMAHRPAWGWHGRIRIKGSFWVYRRGKRPCKMHRSSWAAGKALFWPHVYVTKPECGPGQLARGRPLGPQDYGGVVSDERPEAKTFEEYGRRFAIEENFLDDQSTGFPLESSRLRSANALERLCGVLALTTLAQVAQGTAVVTQGTRRWGDAHWLRGQSSLNIGWNWVKRALSKGQELITRVHISPQADPVPALASTLQHQNPPPRFFAFEVHDAVA